MYLSMKVLSYDYDSASQLLEDFWREAERIMGGK
jgi:YD repeat-containing protein